MGGIGRQPLGGGGQSGYHDLLNALILKQHMTSERERVQERRTRLSQEQATTDRLLRTEANQRRTSLFNQEVEEATGIDPTKDPSIRPFLGQSRELMEPGAFTTAPLDSGNLVNRPVMGDDVRRSLMSAVPRIKEAAQAQVGVLPEGPEREQIARRVALGGVSPAEVPKIYQQTLDTSEKAQKLGQERALAPGVIEGQSLDLQQKRLDALYAPSIKKSQLAASEAATAASQAETRIRQTNLGEVPVVPGSKMALDLEHTRAEIENAHAQAKVHSISAQNQALTLDQHKRYITAMDDFRRTGDISHLNRAVTFATNGANDVQALRAAGEKDTRDRAEFIAKLSNNIMEKDQILSTHIAKGNTDQAALFANDKNLLSTQMSIVAKQPTVNWTTVYQEDGILGRSGSPVLGSTHIKREEALAIQNGQVDPGTVEGLDLIIRTRYAPLIQAGQLDRVLEKAKTIPGVTAESLEGITKIINRLKARNAPAPGSPMMIRAPRVGGSTSVVEEPN